jgi:putative DNA primase/helicase
MPGNKDFCILLQGKLLVELGEMHAFSRAEVTAVKTAVSRRVDTFRAPFGRRSEDHRRQGSLIGTTNQFEWAQDPTGGRRFWPIRCGAVDLEWLVANRNQLFAEAVRDVRAGRSWHEMPLEEAKAQQEARFETDLWEDAIRDRLAKMTGGETTSLEIARHVYEMKLGNPGRGDNRRIAAIMRRLGWTLKHAMKGNYWTRP